MNDARRVGRDHEHHRELPVLHQPVVGDEGVVGQHRSGRHHLRPRDDDAGIGFLDVAAHVADLVGRPVAVHRMDDGVIDEGHALLAELVPAARIVLVGIVEVGIGAERRQERRLVVGARPIQP